MQDVLILGSAILWLIVFAILVGFAWKKSYGGKHEDSQ